MNAMERNPLSHRERVGVRGGGLCGYPLAPEPLTQPSPEGRGLHAGALHGPQEIPG
jgi:hypothetical protein